MITEYCQIINDLPMLVTDILGKLVDMLKVETNFKSYYTQTDHYSRQIIIIFTLFSFLMLALVN